MPIATIPNVRIAGLAAAVPAIECCSWDNLDSTGNLFQVARRRCETPWRRTARIDQCQSDFCVKAGKLLLTEMGWQPDEVSLIVMATLTPDYPIPATAIIVQDRLGVPKTAAAFDLPSGALGFLHGLQIVAGMLSSGFLKRGLLLTGEVSKTPEAADAVTHRAISGHSGTVCALEYCEGSPPLYFDSGGDGATFEAFHMPVGGVRNPPRPEMFSDSAGVQAASEYVLDSNAVGIAAIRELPSCANRVLSAAGRTLQDVDACYLTPLEFPIEDSIRTSLSIARDRFHTVVPEFGASGSGSLPLAMLARASSRLSADRQTSLLCGIGPGLAWSAACIETDSVVCPDILEI